MGQIIVLVFFVHSFQYVSTPFERCSQQKKTVLYNLGEWVKVINFLIICLHKFLLQINTDSTLVGQIQKLRGKNIDHMCVLVYFAQRETRQKKMKNNKLCLIVNLFSLCFFLGCQSPVSQHVWRYLLLFDTHTRSYEPLDVVRW